jgi:hypothetical protein
MLNDLSSFSSVVLSSRMDAEWSYDRRSGRYRDAKGRFLSKEAVGKIVDGRIGKLETQLKQFTRMLGDGSITLDQWQGSVRESLKAAHIQAATIGYGGEVVWAAQSMDALGNACGANMPICKALCATSLTVAFQRPWQWRVLAFMRKAFVARIGKARK